MDHSTLSIKKRRKPISANQGLYINEARCVFVVWLFICLLFVSLAFFSFSFFLLFYDDAGFNVLGCRADILGTIFVFNPIYWQTWGRGLGWEWTVHDSCPPAVIIMWPAVPGAESLRSQDGSEGKDSLDWVQRRHRAGQQLHLDVSQREIQRQHGRQADVTWKGRGQSAAETGRGKPVLVSWLFTLPFVRELMHFRLPANTSTSVCPQTQAHPFVRNTGTSVCPQTQAPKLTNQG